MTKREIENLLDEAKAELDESDEQDDIRIWTVGVDSDAEPYGDPIVTEMNGGGEPVEVDPDRLDECVVDECDNPAYYPADWGGRCSKCAGRPPDTWPTHVE